MIMLKNARFCHRHVAGYFCVIVRLCERERDKGIGTFVVQIGQPERGDIHFPCLLSAVTQGFSKLTDY